MQVCNVVFTTSSITLFSVGVTGVPTVLIVQPDQLNEHVIVFVFIAVCQVSQDRIRGLASLTIPKRGGGGHVVNLFTIT